MKKKLYLVKREVFASSIKEATTAKGHIYEVSLADERLQPENGTKVEGFTKNNK